MVAVYWLRVSLNTDCTTALILRPHDLWHDDCICPLSTTAHSQTQHPHLSTVSTTALVSGCVYDAHTHEYCGPFRVDDNLVLSCYDDFVVELSRDGSYSDMLTVLVLSTVIHKPVQTRWPITIYNNEDSPLFENGDKTMKTYCVIINSSFHQFRST